jgi:hypothetical protein
MRSLSMLALLPREVLRFVLCPWLPPTPTIEIANVRAAAQSSGCRADRPFHALETEVLYRQNATTLAGLFRNGLFFRVRTISL